MSAAVDGLSPARAWVEYLRAGGTTPWMSWIGVAEPPAPGEPDTPAPPEPAGRLLPGAQQLELLRTVNLAAPPAGVPAALVERVLAASAPGRGPLDLPLAGACDDEPFGAPPVDPATLPARELLRLATGLIAEDAAALPPPAAIATESAPRPLPWRRHPGLVGDPRLAAALREQLVATRHRPGRVDVLVLGGDLEHLLGSVWTARVVAGRAVSWSAFCRSWAERDRLPPRADLAALAATWTRRGRRVRIVTDPTAVSRLVRARRPLAVPAPVPAAAAEIALRVSQVLGVLVPAERRPGLTRVVLDTAVATVRAAARDDELGRPPVVPAVCRPWLLEQARRQREALAAAEYPVHGRLEAIAPREQPPTEERPDQGPDEGALTLAVRMLLDTGPGSLHQGARRETRDQA